MKAQAHARSMRITPRKAQEVAKLVRGKNVNVALANLKYLPRKKAGDIFSKLLKSAAANAVDQQQVDMDALFVEQIRVDKGPVMKRFQPRAMGRAFRINKKTSHISVTLGVK
jgi:large subunit ribosomal protein L22